MDKGVVGDKEHANQNHWEGNSTRPNFSKGPLPLCNSEVNVDSYNVRQSHKKVDETIPEPHVLSEDNEEFFADQKVSIPYEGGDLIDIRKSLGNTIVQETAQ